jgi:hypothetical protein
VSEIIRAEADDVQGRLGQMGLDEKALADVVRRGYIAFISCTANDPPLYPGFTAWAQMVRGLREYLLPKQWERSDENNYSLVINPIGTIAIAVATGDAATGRRDATPTTKSTRGTCTLEAVTVNQAQLNLPFEFPPLPVSMRLADANDKRLTWILLVHRDTHEVRCELSLPLSMGNDNRIDSWQERIILDSIPIDPELLELTVPPMPPSPDVTVDVKRRA